MRIELRINDTYQQITSRNPETIARWMGEFLTRQWHHSDFVQLYITPTYDEGISNPDWIQDTYWFSDLAYGRQIHSPREFWRALGDVLDKYESGTQLH